MRARLSAGAFALGAALAGCGTPEEGEATSPPPVGSHRVQARAQAIRPTDGTGWNGNGYDTQDVFHLDSPGGHFRVFYTLTGDSAVDKSDVDPRDGVPTLVHLVAESADRTWQSTVVERGYLAPLDDSLYHDRPDYGGDGRFDIYLRTVGRRSDGYRVDEVCTEVPFACAGYFVMAPSFRGSSYKSDREAAEVLTSHELFHNVQSAYDARQFQTWSEGTAVWNETQVFPEGGLRDFLAFLPAFLDEPERPFDKTMGTGPGGSYVYGSALWPQYLGERFGSDIVRQIWERCVATVRGKSPPFLDATAEVLAGRGASLEATWQEFTGWNLLTAGRASAGRGYRLAARYPGVRLEPAVRGLGDTTVLIEGLSARYLQITPGLEAPRRLRLLFVDESDTPAAGMVFIAAAGGKPGEGRTFPSGKIDLEVAPGDTLFVVLTGVVRGADAHPVTVRLYALPDAPSAEMMEQGCAVAAPGGVEAASGRGLGLGGLLLFSIRALHRRRRPQRVGGQA